MYLAIMAEWRVSYPMRATATIASFSSLSA